LVLRPATERDPHREGEEGRRSVRYAVRMSTRLFGRVWTGIERHPTIADGAFAAALCVLALLALRVAWPFFHPVPAWAAVGLTVLLIAPLTWRRRFPLVVLLVMVPIIVVYQVVDIPEWQWTVNSGWIALYSAGAYGGDRWRNRARAIGVAAIIALVVYEVFVEDVPGESDMVLARVLVLVSNVVVAAWFWWFGDVMRVRRQREAQLAVRTLQLEREREENARRAVLDERVRIARELHDVVAHHVSLMGVQAGAARRVLTRRPEKAEEALAAIEAASRQAVREMQRLLGFLRQERDDDPLTPQPTMHQLDNLVAQMREAGLAVELAVEGEERPLPPSVDLSAYRIVQEALTNTLKHAGPATAAVTVRYGDRALEIEVVDDGRGRRDAGQVNGSNGLIGMRERVSLLGGRLQVGQDAGAGFSVRAHLPLEGQPA